MNISPYFTTDHSNTSAEKGLSNRFPGFVDCLPYLCREGVYFHTSLLIIYFTCSEHGLRNRYPDFADGMLYLCREGMYFYKSLVIVYLSVSRRNMFPRFIADRIFTCAEKGLCRKEMYLHTSQLIVFLPLPRRNVSILHCLSYHYLC